MPVSLVLLMGELYGRIDCYRFRMGFPGALIPHRNLILADLNVEVHADRRDGYVDGFISDVGEGIEHRPGLRFSANGSNSGFSALPFCQR